MGEFLYPRPEGDELEDALDGEEEGEDQVEVAEDVGDVQRGAMELKMARYFKQWTSFYE